MATDIPHFIGGKRVPGCSGRSAPVYNPVTREVTRGMEVVEFATGVILAELLQEAGLPDGVFQAVHGDKQAVDAILPAGRPPRCARPGHRRSEVKRAVDMERPHGQGHADREEAEEHGGKQGPEELKETTGPAMPPFRRLRSCQSARPPARSPRAAAPAGHRRA